MEGVKFEGRSKLYGCFILFVSFEPKIDWCLFAPEFPPISLSKKRKNSSDWLLIFPLIVECKKLVLAFYMCRSLKRKLIVLDDAYSLLLRIMISVKKIVLNKLIYDYYFLVLISFCLYVT